MSAYAVQFTSLPPFGVILHTTTILLCHPMRFLTKDIFFWGLPHENSSTIPLF